MSTSPDEAKIRQSAYLLVGKDSGDPAATCVCGCGVLWHFAPLDPCCPTCDGYRWVLPGTLAADGKSFRDHALIKSNVIRRLERTLAERDATIALAREWADEELAARLDEATP